MFEYISGNVTELSPTYTVVETNGIGYLLQISLQTYSQLKPETRVKLLIHEAIREDAHILYGFFGSHEREMFRLLISVSGVGANTARMILSAMQTDELASVIAAGNTQMLKMVKGIGAKSAERIIVDLKDKVAKLGVPSEIIAFENNSLRNEALSALVMLGFPKNAVEKVLTALLKDDKPATVEELIKKALRQL